MFDDAQQSEEPKTQPFALKLRHIPEDDLQLENTMASLAVSGVVPLLTQEANYSWAAVPISPGTPCHIIHVSFDDQDMKICVSRNILTGLLGDIVTNHMPPHVSAATSALVLEHLLTSVLQPLETALDTNIRILSLSEGYFGKAALSAFRFDLDCSGIAKPGTICIQTEHPDWLLDQFRGMVKETENPIPEVSIELQFLANDFNLRQGDLDRLGTGDCLVLDGDWSQAKNVRMIVGRTLWAPLYEGRSGFKLQERLKQLHLPPLNTSSKKDKPMQSKNDDDTFNYISVNVSVEIDRKVIPLSELRKYTAGSVIMLETKMPETVRLLANNKPLANAELVKVGDKIAVQISELL